LLFRDYRRTSQYTSAISITIEGLLEGMEQTDTFDLLRITTMPGQRSGQPCIRGLRVTVWDVLAMLPPA